MLSRVLRTVLSLILLMIAHPLFAAEKAIVVEVIVKAPIDDVWQAWTTTDGVKSFFAPDAHVQLQVDGPFEIFFNPYAKPGEKGADGMRIIGFQESKMLSFTWNAPPHLLEARKQRSVVIVRFAPDGKEGTRVTLHHVAWGEGGEWDKAYEYFSKAWPNVLKSLQTRFEHGPKDWTQWLEQLKKMTK